MLPYFPKTRQDHATLGHSISSIVVLFHTLITSDIRANIYKFIYSTCLSKHYQNIFINHTSLYLYIYIHQSWLYQHLRTLNHSLVIILLGNSNNQSCVTYNSTYCHPNQISTVHSEELHVMDHLSKFHLNRTVNELGNAIFRKLLKPEKYVAPRAKKIKAWRRAVSQMRPAVPAA